MSIKRRGLVSVALMVGLVAGAATMVTTPVSAHVASWAHNWTEHIKPRTDARYYTKAQSNAKYLQVASTQRGSYFISAEATGAGVEDGTQISFRHHFPAPPTTHFIAAGAATPAGCTGSSASPGALPGHLCVFEDGGINQTGQGMCSNVNVSCPGASRFGSSLYIFSVGAGRYQSWGTWAATPGPGAAAARTTVTPRSTVP